MSGGQEPKSVFGRNDVRAAIAIGYAALFAFVFWPGQEPVSGSQAIAAQKPVQVAEAVGSPVKTAVPAVSDKEAAAAIAALAKISDYQTARWHPLHFKPAIDTASNGQCLACHREVLDAKPREKSPAGVTAAQSVAWYQTLDTYEGEQTSFHARHISTPFAKTVMNLQCNFCHKGNDPREEAQHSSATSVNDGVTMRKMVDPSKTCLMCHGKFPGKVMGFEDQPWHALREGMETPDAPNGCLSCHADQFRTERHKVNYLNAAAIESEAKTKSDTCFGCHGGRAWYRNSYPYPRHPWPGMDPAVPDWAKDRPTQSAAEHLAGVK